MPVSPGHLPRAPSAQAERAAVAIVGAGPVGMTCALRLAGFGVSSLIIEANASLVPQGSKACLIHGDALEILDKCGCAGPIAREGVAWRIGHTYVRGREIRRSEYPVRPGFGEFVNISQYRIEQVLLEAIERLAGTRISWSSRVTGLRADRQSVSLDYDTPDGRRTRSFRYVIACDGVHSAMRCLAGVKWRGYTHADRFLITDIQAKLPFAKERHFHYDPPFNRGRQVVIHPQPDDVWRIDWQLPADADIAAELADGRFDRRVRAVIGDRPYAVKWWSTYRFHQRVVDAFRVGNVFFAGDAAHALPPYGARGMNSGIQDADNLAWKIGAVMRGLGNDDLLDTYHHERRAAADENLRLTEATIRFMVPSNPVAAAYRSLVLATSRFSATMRDRVNSGRMTQPFRYRPSAIIHAGSEEGLAGWLFPDVVLEGTGMARLRPFFGHGFAVLALARPGTGPAGLPAVPTVSWPQDVTRLLLVPADAPPDLGGRGRQASARQWRVCRYSRLPPELEAPGDDLFLIRPDGHVAGTYKASEMGDMDACLRRACGLPAPNRAQDTCLLQPERVTAAAAGGHYA